MKLNLPNIPLILLAILPSTLFSQMVEIEIRGPSPDDDFLTWSPVAARARFRFDPPAGETTVILRNAKPDEGGQLSFGNADATAAEMEDDLELDLPSNGDWANFKVSGKFPFASFGAKDAVLQAVSPGVGGEELGKIPAMVRVRKNANTLNATERKLFLDALKTFRQTINPTGENFALFHQIHNSAGYFQAHSSSAFLPWHRAFLLYFERRLQQIDPHVTLPYWRFDKAAPELLSADFIGASGSASNSDVNFSGSNPLSGWRIRRISDFNPGESPGLLSQAETIALGDAFLVFNDPLERDPHGPAHIAAGTAPGVSWIANPTTAAQDPLFFLLHCNVDRLWARWQLVNGRFGDGEDSYSPRGTFPTSGQARINSYSGETMWPWNDKVDNVNDPARPEDRPPSAPGGPMPVVVGIAPPATPTPEDMLDYLGSLTPDDHLGFCYDDLGVGSLLDND